MAPDCRKVKGKWQIATNAYSRDITVRVLDEYKNWTKDFSKHNSIVIIVVVVVIIIVIKIVIAINGVVRFLDPGTRSHNDRPWNKLQIKKTTFIYWMYFYLTQKPRIFSGLKIKYFLPTSLFYRPVRPQISPLSYTPDLYQLTIIIVLFIMIIIVIVIIIIMLVSVWQLTLCVAHIVQSCSSLAVPLPHTLLKHVVKYSDKLARLM